MLGNFPSKHSRINLPDLLSRERSSEENLNLKTKEDGEPISFLDQANYFGVRI